MLVIFFGTFIWMVVGVSKLGWWFEEMTDLFLRATILIGFLSGLSEKDFVDKFVAGAGDFIMPLMGMIGSLLLLQMKKSVTETNYMSIIECSNI